MSLNEEITVKKLTSREERLQALEVFGEVYTSEKGWVDDRDKILPLEDLDRNEVDWFIAIQNNQIVGVTRVLYEIPFELYEAYGFELTVPGLDVEAFIRNNRIAEVGRFAVLPQYRNQMKVSALLMRATGNAAINRGFTHFITDVFEDDPNTPYGFHRRVLGFQVVATHEVGELNCKSRRITMLLDLKQAAQRIASSRGWFYRFLNKDAVIGKGAEVVASAS